MPPYPISITAETSVPVAKINFVCDRKCRDSLADLAASSSAASIARGCKTIYEKPAAQQGVRVRRACLRTKRHEHALVIPVLNEGAPVKKQLQRIHAATPAVDIIIADGGSTDRFLQEDFLASVGVRALLVKRGPGKVGAQMRMAYASALYGSYAGIDKSLMRASKIDRSPGPPPPKRAC